MGRLNQEILKRLRGQGQYLRRGHGSLYPPPLSRAHERGVPFLFFHQYFLTIADVILYKTTSDYVYIRYIDGKVTYIRCSHVYFSFHRYGAFSSIQYHILFPVFLTLGAVFVTYVLHGYPFQKSIRN